jgi:hypothetical protein
VRGRRGALVQREARGRRKKGREAREAQSTRKGGAKKAQEAAARGRNERGTHLGAWGAEMRRATARRFQIVYYLVHVGKGKIPLLGIRIVPSLGKGQVSLCLHR